MVGKGCIKTLYFHIRIILHLQSLKWTSDKHTFSTISIGTMTHRVLKRFPRIYLCTGLIPYRIGNGLPSSYFSKQVRLWSHMDHDLLEVAVSQTNVMRLSSIFSKDSKSSTMNTCRSLGLLAILASSLYSTSATPTTKTLNPEKHVYRVNYTALSLSFIV